MLTRYQALAPANFGVALPQGYGRDMRPPSTFDSDDQTHALHGDTALRLHAVLQGGVL
jgi:hypothetical protein